MHTENVLKTGINQEMWLRYFIENKNGLSITFLVVVFFSSFNSIFSMTAWNTIDDLYSNFVLYIVTKPHFLSLPIFKAFSGRQCGILSMIDTPNLSSI